VSLPANLKPAFEAIMCEPLGDTRQLRRRVANFAHDIEDRTEAHKLDIDPGEIQRIAATLELMLGRVSRKTTPLHHRLIHATAEFCSRGPERGRPLDVQHFRDDVIVINETARVIRRPELTLSLSLSALRN